MTFSNIIRVVQTTLIAIGLVFGISVVVAGHWWADEYKLDVDKLGQSVTSSLQVRLDTEDNTKNLGLHVGKNIFLINVNGTGNEYRGMVTVETRKFTGVPVALIVYADASGRWMWEMDPLSSVRLSTTAEQEQQR
jgi:hypothetical protein